MKTKLVLLFFAIVFSGLVKAEPNEAKHRSEQDLAEMEMKDLLNMQVTSASKKAQSLSDAPSAIYVISQDDIKRSGVTSIPEALRMAPGIDVARINANKWAITARGFNGSLANKLLVLIDGRSVYSPAFSGVYWDAQDTMIEDIDRIEVIRGPGATLWGSNAVNGVINIITKSAEKTQEGLLVGGGGSLETGFGGLRYGVKLGKDTYARAYIKGFERDNFALLESGHGNANDNWSRVQGGFKLESRLSDKDEVTLQGDLYRSALNQRATTPSFAPPYSNEFADSFENLGWNITSRWRHKLSSTSEYSLQFYYDHTRRPDFLTEQWLDTLDVDFQHNFELTDNQNIIWGLGYRANLDKFVETEVTSFNPERRNTQLFSAFVQDEIELVDNSLWLTIGSKFEHNDYSGFEGQPSVRLMWAPTPRQRVWGAFSRSVRTPSRYESDIEGELAILGPGTRIPGAGVAQIPIAVKLLGEPNFKAEVQLAYELGYRFAFSDRASIDMTAFYSDYDKLRSFQINDPFIEDDPLHLDIPIKFNNLLRASTWGFEAANVWQVTDWLRWDVNYSYIGTAYDTLPHDAISPKHKVSFRAAVNPLDNVNLDFWIRYNGSAQALNPTRRVSLPTLRTIKGYVTFDVRLAWKPHPAVELSLVGQNLFANRHLEYTDETFVTPTVVPRSFYGKVAIEF